MWETPFDVSMLSEPNLIVFCPEEQLAVEFLETLEENGVDCRRVNSLQNAWKNYKEETCYWVENGIISYAYRHYAEDPESEGFDDVDYSDYIKCTFYGTQPEEIEEVEEIDPIDEDEWLNLLHAAK